MEVAVLVAGHQPAYFLHVRCEMSAFVCPVVSTLGMAAQEWCEDQNHLSLRNASDHASVELAFWSRPAVGVWGGERLDSLDLPSWTTQG